MESNSNSSYDCEDDLSCSSFSYTSNPERSNPRNTDRQWDDEETDFHRREYSDGERNRESSYDYQENLGRSYASYPSAPERSPPTHANRQWDDGGQDHKYGKQLNREFNKSRPYFIKNRGNPRDESNNREERQRQQIRQSLQPKAAQLKQPSSQQQNRPVYSEYSFNQADLTCVDRNSRPFSNEAERQQQQKGQSLQQETFQSQPTSQQETPINSTHGFNQEDCWYMDASTQALPSTCINSNKQALPDPCNDTNKLTFSNRANKYAHPHREEWQQQQVQQPFLRGKSQADLTPPQQIMPIFPAFGFYSADHSFTRRPPPLMPPYNYSPAPTGINPMNLPFNLSATALPDASALPGTSNLPVAFSLPTASGVGLGPNISTSMIGQDGAFYPKELITLTKGIMCPPYPEDKPPSLRPRPPGCKTVFIGGLPEKATEEIIREIFERCGEISIIRMKKNFCFIRFTEECYVDKAIDLSGYKLKIERKDDPPHCNRLHVDFSYSREDEHEYKCHLQKKLREARHKQKMEEDARRKKKIEEEARRKQKMEEEARRVPTPPPVVPYSDKEASILVEKLRGTDTFQEALGIFITWLERGECKKQNVANFYSMVQSANSRVRILLNEKQKCEDDVNKAKIMLEQKIQYILLQFNEIGKVYTAASLQKVWDHFTKAQRKNVKLWKKHMEEVKNLYLEELLDDRVEDEMNISDDDAANQQQENKNSGQQNLLEELLIFKEECDSLKCQLITTQNEFMQLRSEMEKKCDFAESQAGTLRQALQGLWQENASLTEKHLKNEEELKKQKAMLLNEGREDWNFDDNTEQKNLFGFLTSASVRLITQNEARLIGLISTFLSAYPLGTSIDCICTYLHQNDGTIRTKDVENFMKRFTFAFKEEFIDDSLEKKWTFLGFK